MSACGFVLVTVGVQGADPGLQLQLQHDLPEEAVIESPADEALAFWERFKSAFEERAGDNFADRMHPFGSLNWGLRMDDVDAEGYRERTSASARKALTKSVKNSVREATVDL